MPSEPNPLSVKWWDNLLEAIDIGYPYYGVPEDLRMIRDEIRAKDRRIAELEAALRYIECPTMGYHDDGASPEEFARTLSDLDNARGALATCIYIATNALDKESPDAD